MFARICLTLTIALLAMSCSANQDIDATGSGHRILGGEVSTLGPTNDPLSQGKFHFRRQDFGLAEKYFRRAAEDNPKRVGAWLGLAASYDKLRRFELAERAYGVVVKLIGHTAAVHNNLGYHYYLKGDQRKAKEHILAAYQMDPDNPHILSNLKLVDKSKS